MLLELPELLNPAQLNKVLELVGRAEARDGRETAGRAAAQVKANEELVLDADSHQLLQRILMSALGHHARFRSAALPNRMADFILARYRPGMAYGDHVDDPLMGLQGPKFRTDLAMTIFLNGPERYKGGELVVRTSYGEHSVKLDAGSAVLYPSASLHRVAEVSAGERLVAVTWIQSFVRSAEQRELLYELDLVREHLLATAPDDEQTQRIMCCYANMLRILAEV